MRTNILTPFETQIDRLFDDAVHALGHRGREYVPSCNVWEDADQVGVELALPGWQSNEVTIQAENGVVTVAGARTEQRGEEKANGTFYHVREIGKDSFARSFRLPNNLEWNRANATFAHGILTIAFPKREDAKSRHIPIQ